MKPTLKDMTKEQKMECVMKILKGEDTISGLAGLTTPQLEAIYAMGYNYYASRKYIDAIKIFSWLTLMKPMEAKYLLGLGAALQSLKRYAEAFRAFMFSAVADAENPAPYLYAAECCASLGQKEQALKILALSKENAVETKDNDHVCQRIDALISSLRTGKGA
ncbi:MAG: SycD/LcrH family type III secretion system chaperone [Nitrospirae bacterium]|nr:SycD/LcrH family type III secretion system chaperone [Nitrospirota bacterium]